MKKLLRKYSDSIQIHKDYIDVLLRLAGYRLSDMSVTILAYSSYRKALTSETKKEIAEKCGKFLCEFSRPEKKTTKFCIRQKNDIIFQKKTISD